MLAEWFVDALTAYGAVGLVFAAVFVAGATRRLDRNLKATGWGFRAIILPGVIALWPMLLMRVARRRS